MPWDTVSNVRRSRSVSGQISPTPGVLGSDTRRANVPVIVMILSVTRDTAAGQCHRFAIAYPIHYALRPFDAF